MARRFVPITDTWGTPTGCRDTVTGEILPANSPLCDPRYGAMVKPATTLIPTTTFPSTVGSRAVLKGISAASGTRWITAGLCGAAGALLIPKLVKFDDSKKDKRAKIGVRIVAGGVLFFVGWQLHDALFKAPQT